MKLFENKVVVIIGVGLGIGCVLVVELGRQGCYLVLVDVNVVVFEEIC